MVGIVIISHSKQLALGVQELAVQMAQGQVPLAIAAGIGDPLNPLGTNAMEVYQAIASVYSDDGVLILMDLGSALISAETALDFLPPEKRDKVYLCAAPLVEGAIAAVVAAVAGKSIQQIMVEAQGALTAKVAELGNNLTPANIPLSIYSQELKEKSHQIRLTIHNRWGLHARPAAQFVSTASRFQSQIYLQNLTRGSDLVRGDSINQVATLGVRQGQELLITATGVDAEAALSALKALVMNNFGEGNQIEPPMMGVSAEVIPPTPGELRGIAAADGIAIATVVQYESAPVAITLYHIENPEVEWRRLQAAIQTAKQEIQSLLSHTSIQIGDAEAAIFDAHLLCLQDPVLLELVHQQIIANLINAESAWQTVIDQVAGSYLQLEDVYLQELFDNVVDVGQRVLRILLGNPPTNLELSTPSILITTDLTPSDTAKLDPTKVLGLCMTAGSATSHSAIIARTLGIPAVLGVNTQVLDLPNGTLMALDGGSGRVWITPSQDVLELLTAKHQASLNAQQEAKSKAHQPAITRDGRRIQVLANIRNVADAQLAIAHGAEGVGLLRTEFLYFDRDSPPDEHEQWEFYQAIAKVVAHRPLIIRTLDVGGDKPLPYFHSKITEANPFLGCRGIRFCLEQPHLFKTQLRAILRASRDANIKVMLPMITSLTEVLAAKSILSQVQAELIEAQIPFDQQMEVGIMIETPAAVAIADQLAGEVDFFSIGTNDLSQYVMAADRTNPRVVNLTDAMHPAVLRMIQKTVQAANQGNIWVGLCGEVASEVLLTPILLGLGLDELSVNPQAIAPLKQAIARLEIAGTQAIADLALQQDCAARVREIMYTVE